MGTKTLGSPPGGVAFRLTEIETGAGFIGGVGTNAPAVGNFRYSPVQVPHACTAQGIVVIHGAVAAGNLYVALYNSAALAPNQRLAVSADTVNAGVSRKQYVPFITPVSIIAGLYFCCLESAVAGDTYARHVGLAEGIAPVGLLNGIAWFIQQTGVYQVPPAVAVPVQTVTTTQTNFMRLRVTA